MLLDYVLFAPLLLRVVLGLFIINFGWNKLTKEREHKMNFFASIGLKPASVYLTLLGILQIVVGICLILGLATQIAAIITAIIMLVSYIIKKREPTLMFSPSSIYILLFFISLSLILTGAGIPAVDLPF
ncbi:MAG: hypothetical protein RL094_64 [Candidatus Parcubacteria bacterium]